MVLKIRYGLQYICLKKEHQNAPMQSMSLKNVWNSELNNDSESESNPWEVSKGGVFVFVDQIQTGLVKQN